MLTENVNKLNLLKSTSHISQKRAVPFMVVDRSQLNQADSWILDCTLDSNLQNWVNLVKTNVALKPVICLIDALNKKEATFAKLQLFNLGHLWNPDLVVDLQSNWAVLLQAVEKSFAAPAPELKINNSQTDANASNFFRKTLSFLIVDDSETVRKFVEAKLKDEMPCALKLDYAETGALAIKKCEAHKYDVLFLDVMLPDMDGYSICKHLKNTQNMSSLAVMLTSKNGVFDKLKGVMSGCDMYLVKPLDAVQVSNLVKKLEDRNIL
jgi:CheY-like chemotaxis protein